MGKSKIIKMPVIEIVEADYEDVTGKQPKRNENE